MRSRVDAVLESPSSVTASLAVKIVDCCAKSPPGGPLTCIVHHAIQMLSPNELNGKMDSVFVGAGKRLPV